MDGITERQRNLQGCGFIPGRAYYLKLRRNISLCLTARSHGDVCLGNELNNEAMWCIVLAPEAEERLKDPDGNFGLFIGDKNGLGEFRYDRGDVFRGIFKDGEFQTGTRCDQNGKITTMKNGGWDPTDEPDHGVAEKYKDINIAPENGYFFIRLAGLNAGKPYLSCTADGILKLSDVPAWWSAELHGRWRFLSVVEKESGMHLAADHYVFPNPSPKSRSQHITSAYSQESAPPDRRAHDDEEAATVVGSAIMLRRYVSNLQWETRQWRAVPVGGPAETVICIGDLHGHIDRCINLWDKLKDQLGKERLDTAMVVFLGDYCDRGPNTKAVYDWLIQLCDSRPEGKTAFVTGNHDLAFASFIGCPPFVCPEGFDLDSTNSKRLTSADGVWALPVEGGMHFQGRRWGGSTDKYNGSATFASYGVVNDHTTEARERLIAAVPQTHKDFLSNLNWMYELDVSFPPGKLIAIHAGIRTDRPVEPQLALLKARRVDAIELQEKEFGRFHALSGRSEVVGMHPDLEGKAIVVSGHHGDREINGDRFINDLSGGRNGRPLEALIFPERQWISTDEPGNLCDGTRKKVQDMDAIRSTLEPRLQAAWEAGIIPGAEYHLKLRKHMSFCLNARSEGQVQLWDSLGDHQRWIFQSAEDGYFKLQSRFHMNRGDGTCSYLARDETSDTLRIATEGSLFSVELHGRLHFVALVEKNSGKHIALDFAMSPQRGADVKLVTYVHDESYQHRHWSLALVPVDPVD